MLRETEVCVLRTGMHGFRTKYMKYMSPTYTFACLFYSYTHMDTCMNTHIHKQAYSHKQEYTTYEYTHAHVMTNTPKPYILKKT